MQLCLASKRLSSFFEQAPFRERLGKLFRRGRKTPPKNIMPLFTKWCKSRFSAVSALNESRSWRNLGLGVIRRQPNSSNKKILQQAMLAEKYTGLCSKELECWSNIVRSYPLDGFLDFGNSQSKLYIIACERLLSLNKKCRYIPWIHRSSGYLLRVTTPIKEWLTLLSTRYKSVTH